MLAHNLTSVWVSKLYVLTAISHIVGVSVCVCVCVLQVLVAHTFLYYVQQCVLWCTNTEHVDIKTFIHKHTHI